MERRNLFESLITICVCVCAVSVCFVGACAHGVAVRHYMAMAAAAVKTHIAESAAGRLDDIKHTEYLWPSIIFLSVLQGRARSGTFFFANFSTIAPVVCCAVDNAMLVGCTWMPLVHRRTSFNVLNCVRTDCDDKTACTGPQRTIYGDNAAIARFHLARFYLIFVLILERAGNGRRIHRMQINFATKITLSMKSDIINTFSFSIPRLLACSHFLFGSAKMRARVLCGPMNSRKKLFN